MAAASDVPLLELIIELARHLERRLSGMEWSFFLSDPDEADLTAYRVLHIGEAARRLSASTKALAPDIDWNVMIGARNVFSHDYMAVDRTMLWHTATESVPTLTVTINRLIERLR
jgi:uncharacterized protein with HEPN domain